MLIVIKRKDGGVSIMKLSGQTAAAYDAAPEHGDIIIEKEIEQWEATQHDHEKSISWRIMPDDAIPNDDTFSGAWTDTTSELKIDIDMNKAKEIHRGRMREARASLLASLDINYMRADEIGDTIKKQTIVAQKQELRDVTKHSDIDKAITPEQLKTIWPRCLG